jgi:hypothetical protein
MRPIGNRHLVLLPTANRNRFLGPNLARQMQELQSAWTPWDRKSDAAWWGGAFTGINWANTSPYPLTRRAVLEYFDTNPSDRMRLHLTEIPEHVRHLTTRKHVEPRFTPLQAFQNKCLVLLPGNDIASGSSWYFAGNSVVLMPKPHLEHILYFGLEPWVHYVPLENDPKDILKKLEWVLDNETKAQEIVAQSHERLRWFCGPEYLWACNEILRQIAPESRAQ